MKDHLFDLYKEKTKGVHTKVERHPFNLKLFNGSLSEKEIQLYLYIQYIVFKELEEHELYKNLRFVVDLNLSAKFDVESFEYKSKILDNFVKKIRKSRDYRVSTKISKLFYRFRKT